VNNGSDSYFAALDVAGYNYSPERYEEDHVRDPARVIVATESFPLESYTYWEGVWDNAWVIGDFIWTAMDYIGESAIGGNGFNTPDLRACSGYCPQGWSWHISFCGDIDIVGLQKPQSLYRQVLWNVSDLEVAVHAPVPAGQHEVVAQWGWPDERCGDRFDDEFWGSAVTSSV
jgi:beta-galactosidase